MCNHILFGVKSIFNSTNVHSKELTYSNRTQKISICLVHIWFMALSSTFSMVNCDLWWCTLVHGAMVTCENRLSSQRHRNVIMLSSACSLATTSKKTEVPVNDVQACSDPISFFSLFPILTFRSSFSSMTHILSISLLKVLPSLLRAKTICPQIFRNIV